MMVCDITISFPGRQDYLSFSKMQYTVAVTLLVAMVSLAPTSVSVESRREDSLRLRRETANAVDLVGSHDTLNAFPDQHA